MRFAPARRSAYSTQGPGRLDSNKPDLSCYTHFVGSGVYDADSGTSAACPVAAGVVAALRTAYPPSTLSPAQLRNLLRRSADDIGLTGFDYDHGFGIVDPPAVLRLLDRADARPLRIGEHVSGHLAETLDTQMFKLSVGTALNIALDGPTGADFDIYVRKGQEPTVTEYDYRGYTSSADERLRISPLEPGDYYVLVRSYRGGGDFLLSASID